jgi:hypothetical protein
LYNTSSIFGIVKFNQIPSATTINELFLIKASALMRTLQGQTSSKNTDEAVETTL